MKLILAYMMDEDYNVQSFVIDLKSRKLWSLTVDPIQATWIHMYLGDSQISCGNPTVHEAMWCATMDRRRSHLGFPCLRSCELKQKQWSTLLWFAKTRESCRCTICHLLSMYGRQAFSVARLTLWNSQLNNMHSRAGKNLGF